MKSASPALIALLNSQQFYMTDLLTLTLIGGGVIRLASTDIDIVSGGHTFGSSGPFFERGRTRTVIGVEVDTLDLTFYANSSHTISGQPFIQAVCEGVLDGAYVLLERTFMASWGDTSAGTVVLFSGRVSDLPSVGRTEVKVNVKSDLELLNVKMPRNLWQPPCPHTLFDAGCGLSKAAWGVAGTALAGSTVPAVVVSLPQYPGWFDLGSISFTSGANAGVTRTVRSYVPGTLQLINPLPNAPAPGDAFTVYPGCDHQQATCSGKFNNLANFRGCPYIPIPESAY